MNRFLALRPGRVALVLALALVLASAAVVAALAPTAPGNDLLDRPARVGVHADQAVLIGIAPAGHRLVAVGERGIVLLSDDGGSTWRQAQVPVSVALTAVSFATEKIGWAVGHGGAILRSDDGGEHWTTQLDGRAIGAIELAAVQAAGGDGAPRRIADAQRLVAEGPDKPLLDVAFADASHGIAVGAFGLALRTADGGRSWQSIRSHLPNPQGRHLYDVAIDGNVMLIAGEQGALFRSTDGGDHFEAVTTPYAGSFFGVLPGPGGELLVYGLRGNVFHSTDAGASWTRVELGQPITVTAGLRLADGRVVLVDETGRVLGSSDGGASFQPQAVARPFTFTGAVESGSGRLVLAGARGLTRHVMTPVAKTQP